MGNVTQGEGYSVANLDDIGEGPGFRKIRRELGVEEFGINAIVMPSGIESDFHYHDEQEELYFVHSGELEIEFGDGTVHRLGPGGMARVAAATHRKTRNVSGGDTVYVIVGAKGGYVGRDGQAPDGNGLARVRRLPA
ncbi:MAG TPA: cupin domain-containing protein [Thermoleophilaceae bacterium]|nr:cupin domain-containing protein [Thermoleophilaceae bacterium]